MLILMRQPAGATPQESEAAESARRVLSQRCFHCHGANGVAPQNIFVLDRARLLAAKTIVPGDGDSLLLRVVATGAMPMRDAKLSEEEQSALRNWILAGAPDWSSAPAEPTVFLSETASLAMIRADLEKTAPGERGHIRYFSLAHLANSGTPEGDLERYRIGLAKLVNSLSWNRKITRPQPIDSTRLLFRLDLRDYGWTVETWRRILAVYPYGVLRPEAKSITNLSGEIVPYLRADWFAEAASAPPLYHDILRLPETTRDLEFLAGVDTVRNLTSERNVVRGGVRGSGVSRNNRVLERHATPYGAYWQSYDFRGNAGDQNIFQDPVRLHPAGSEIIFSLPNGLQGYFLADGEGKRIDAAPVEIVSDRHEPEDPVIRSGRSCMSCHFDGMRQFQDDVRPLLRELDRVRFNLKKALALYPPQETLDRALDQDRARFRKAAAQLGGQPADSPETEPVRALARRFEADLDLTQAAAETGLAPGQFEQRLRSSSRLIGMGFGSLLAPNGGVKRDVWERQFRELASVLQIGDVAPAEQDIAPRMTARSVAKKVFVALTRTGNWNSEKSKTLSSAKERAAAVKVLDLVRTPPWTPANPDPRWEH